MNKRQKELARRLLNRKRHRRFTIVESRAAGDTKDDQPTRIRFSASSNHPVLSYVETDDFFGWGYEVLSHKDADMEIERLKEGGHFLLDHNSSGVDNNLGRIRDAELDGQRLDVEVEQNPHNPTADRVFNEILTDFRPNVSIGYQRKDEVGTAIGMKDGKPVVEYASDLYEVSSVLLPADMTVGIGRSVEDFIAREFNLDRSKASHQKLVDELLEEFEDREVDIDEIIDEIELEGRPLGDYEDFDDCVSKNQDKEDPEAYCGAIEVQAEKAAADDEKKKSLIVIDNKQSRSAEDEPEADSKITQEQTIMSEKIETKAPETVSVGTDLAAERQRSNEIYRLGQEDGQLALSVKAVEGGWSIEKFKAELHDVAKTGRKVDIVDAPEKNLAEQEQKELDIRQALSNYLDGGDTSAVDELGREVAKQRGIQTRKNALYIPIHAPIMPRANFGHLLGRAHGTTPSADGGALVGTEYFAIAPALFEQSIGAQVGIQYHTVANLVQVPRFLTNMSVAFVGEESTISLASGSFSTDTATPHQAVAAVPVTTHLGQAVPGTYNPLDTIMANAVGGITELADRSWISGSAAAEPGGMLNLAGIPGGTATALTGSNKLYTELWETVRNNKPSGKLGPFLVSVDTYKYGLENPALAGGSDRPTINTVPANNLNGFTGMTSLGPVVETAHLPSGTALYGQWNQVLFFDFGVMEMTIDESVRRLSGEDVVFARLFVDNVVQEPRAFATGSSILVS